MAMRLLVAVMVLEGMAGTSHAGLFGADETPGERFRKATAREAEYCATHKIKPTNRRCDITTLQPADPLATEEGRFAHSIRIPNPVPADSGYKPGMTPEQYFDHLCKTEAGEFIYKTVEDVEGLYMMRPRKGATDFELEHLYALEDPYGHENWEATAPAPAFVHPGQYGFLEMPITDRREPDWRKKYVHSSLMVPPQPGANIQRYFGYDGRNQKSLQKEYDVNRKSRHGYTWRGITRPHDREMGIAGGELIVLDLEANEVLAVRRGYIRSGDVRKNLTGVWWLGGHVCKSDSTRLFRTVEYIAQVLHPVPTQNKETFHVTK
ncbi:MAG: hypothetical protein WBB60_11695 [Nitrospira sp.]